MKGDRKGHRQTRILRLVAMLQGYRCMTADELIEELQVSRRTLFRDLKVLEQSHIPYFFDRLKKGYRIEKHFFLPPVNLDLTEALSIMMMAADRKPAGELPWRVHARRAAMKLEVGLPPPIRELVGSMLEKMQFRLGPTARHEGLDTMLEQLARAAANRRVCRLAYISFYEGKQIRPTVHPLRLAFIGRAWYLRAWTPRQQEVRTYKLGRIKRLEVTDETFDSPDVSEAESHFGQAWSMIPEGKCHNIHLHFDRQVAGNVAEVQWHASQQVQWRDDGSLDFKVRVDGLGEIAWWILGYGDKVRVLKPAALARKVGAVARRMAGMYAGGEG